MNTLCLTVIPARIASTRFPGKPLIQLEGKPMIQWVYEAALKSNLNGQVVIATPDEEIRLACRKFGAESVLTSSKHESGTDRIAEVAKTMKWNGVILNVQGDEPLIRSQAINQCATELIQDENANMASLYTDVNISDLENTAVVKVVTNLQNYALYFSRYAIPFIRQEATSEERAKLCKRHIGIYAYRSEVLQEFQSWSRTELEIAESLEQLRFLEHGISIKMNYTHPFLTGVDTPEQADEVRKYLRDST